MDTTVSSHPRRMHNSYEDEEERKHFQRIVSAFRYYKWVSGRGTSLDTDPSPLYLTFGPFLFLVWQRQPQSLFIYWYWRVTGEMCHINYRLSQGLNYHSEVTPVILFTIVNNIAGTRGIQYLLLAQFLFCLCRTHSLLRVRKTESYFLSLPQHHQKLLSKYREHLQEVKRCIDNNDQIIKLIVKDVAHIFENVCPTTAQVDNVRNILPITCVKIEFN